MIGWLNDINRLVSKDKREPRVIPAENTHTLALYEKVSAQLAYLTHTLETPIVAGDGCFLLLQNKIARFEEIVKHIIKSLQCTHYWKEKTQIWLLVLDQIA